MATRIAIVGLGAKGTAIGRALVESNLPDVEVWGHDADRRFLAQATKARAIDKASSSVIDTVTDARLIILATPSSETVEVLNVIGSSVGEGAVVTDVAGIKGPVFRAAADCLPPTASFVGGHLIAGKDWEAIDTPGPEAFAGGTYCIVPSVSAAEEAVLTVIDLARLVGAHPYFLDAGEHDAYTIATEVLPVLASAALIRCLRESEGWQDIARVAGSSFGIASYLATTDPVDIAAAGMADGQATAVWLDRLIVELQRLRELALAPGERGGDLRDALASARDERARWRALRPPDGPPGSKIDYAPEAILSFLGDNALARRWPGGRRTSNTG